MQASSPSRVRLSQTGLARRVALLATLPQSEAFTAVGQVLRALSEALVVPGDTVRLRGFGTFEVRVRRARRYRDPTNGGFIERPAVSYIHFKASSHGKGR